MFIFGEFTFIAYHVKTLVFFKVYEQYHSINRAASEMIEDGLTMISDTHVIQHYEKMENCSDETQTGSVLYV